MKHTLPTHNPSRLTGTGALGGYGLAMAALTNSASAAIVARVLNPADATITGEYTWYGELAVWDSLSFQLNGTGFNGDNSDFLIIYDCAGFDDWFVAGENPDFSPSNFVDIQFLMDNSQAETWGSWTYGLEFGDLISGTDVPAGTSWATLFSTWVALDSKYPKDNSSIFVGYRYQEVGMDPSDWHYGWFEMSSLRVTDGGGTLTERSITLHGWGFNSTENAPITAGAVPEPATVGLVLGLLALGVVGWRRKRR